MTPRPPWWPAGASWDEEAAEIRDVLDRLGEHSAAVKDRQAREEADAAAGASVIQAARRWAAARTHAVKADGDENTAWRIRQIDMRSVVAFDAHLSAAKDRDVAFEHMAEAAYDLAAAVAALPEETPNG